MKEKKTVSRRQFLGQTSCAAIGYTTLFSSLLNLKAFEAAAMDNSSLPDDYKALVCVLLSGGNDSYNMLMPRTGDPYAEYLTTRSNLAIPSTAMLPIVPSSAIGDFGVHPSMPEVQSLFNSGRLAFISNVGTMVQPINSIVGYILCPWASSPIRIRSSNGRRVDRMNAPPQAGEGVLPISSPA